MMKTFIAKSQKSAPNICQHKRQTLRGFTLIEIMIVIGIVGLFLGIGIPSMFRAMRKNPMQQTVTEVLEALSAARSQAIMSGSPAGVMFYPLERRFEVVRLPESRAGSLFSDTAFMDGGSIVGRYEAMQVMAQQEKEMVMMDMGNASGGKQKGKVGFFKSSGTIQEDVVLELLDVNFWEYKNQDSALVVFHPNGTCDEFTMVLNWEEKDWRKIEVNVITGLADVGPLIK